MSEQLYLLKYRGELVAGVTPEQVRSMLMQVFALDAARADALLERPEVVLKRGLDEKQAFRYAAKLRQLGLVVAVELQELAAEISATPIAATQPPAEPAPAAAWTEPEETTVTAAGLDATLSRHDPLPRGGFIEPRRPSSYAPQTPVTPPRPVAPVAKPADEDWDDNEGVTAEAFGAGTLTSPRGGRARNSFMPQPQIRMGSGGGSVDTRIRGGDKTNNTRLISFEFTGDGKEFFKIWIVNIFLSIVTLGIYSAWAKVRTMRYFYGNTRLDGSSFEYLADPIKILKGRLIAAALLAIVVIGQLYSWWMAGILTFIVLLATPWVIARSLHFRARYSAWRGIPFRFEGNMLGAGINYVLLGIAANMTLYLLAPLWFRQQIRYVFNNLRFGGVAFENTASLRSFYLIFLKLFGAALAIGLLTAGLSFISPIFVALLSLVFYVLAGAYIKVALMNLRYDGMMLGPHTFQSSYDLPSYAWLLCTNTLGIICTLGLFYPFAKVRSARYAAEHIDVLALGKLDDFVAEQAKDVSAAGSEVGDFFDIDVGF